MAIDHLAAAADAILEYISQDDGTDCLNDVDYSLIIELADLIPVQYRRQADDSEEDDPEDVLQYGWTQSTGVNPRTKKPWSTSRYVNTETQEVKYFPKGPPKERQPAAPKPVKPTREQVKQTKEQEFASRLAQLNTKQITDDVVGEVTDALGKMTQADLQKMRKELGLTGLSKTKGDPLVSALVEFGQGKSTRVKPVKEAAPTPKKFDEVADMIAALKSGHPDAHSLDEIMAHTGHFGAADLRALLKLSLGDDKARGARDKEGTREKIEGALGGGAPTPTAQPEATPEAAPLPPDVPQGAAEQEQPPPGQSDQGGQREQAHEQRKSLAAPEPPEPGFTGTDANGKQVASAASQPLPDFAKEVQSLADAHPVGFGDNKVFIHHVYDEMKKVHPDMTLEDFKGKLKQANQARLLNLSRADLVQAMHPEDVAASHTQIGHDDKAAANFILAKNKERQQTRRDPDENKTQPKVERTPREQKVAEGLANPEEHTLAEWRKRNDYDRATPRQKAAIDAEHKKRVQEALDVDMPVPPEVMAEYSGMKATPPKPKAPKPPATTSSTTHPIASNAATVASAIQKLSANPDHHGTYSVADIMDATGLSKDDVHAALNDREHGLRGKHGAITAQGFEGREPNPRVRDAGWDEQGNRMGYVSVREGQEGRLADLAKGGTQPEAPKPEPKAEPAQAPQPQPATPATPSPAQPTAPPAGKPKPKDKAPAAASPRVNHAANEIGALMQQIAAPGKTFGDISHLPSEEKVAKRLDAIGLEKMSKAELHAIGQQIDRKMPGNAGKPELIRELRRHVLVAWEMAMGGNE